jgi:uncharacterized tellurite resistance protein B-like protein
MLDRLKSLLAPDAAGGPVRRHAPDALHLAAAALLVEAARMDDDYAAAERAVIARLLRERFDLDAADTETLLAMADTQTEESVELYGYTRRLKDAFDHAERIQLVEMLWEVVLADGAVHDHEANLLRRVAGLVYVTDRESGEARKRVLDRTRAAS